ncbi:MAG: hypothetical protein INR71_11520 [Terriglobus roseus]|nr:hypothetical protein [Terriglobus roseus]
MGRHFGRTFNRWADQEVMNYIAIKTDTFDSVTITPFVVHYLPLAENLGGRRGLVHFWGRTSVGKVDAMKEYMEQLRNDLRELPAPVRQGAGSVRPPILFSTDELDRSMPIMEGLRIREEEAE